MPGTTSRLALPYAQGIDQESTYPSAVDQPRALILDNAAIYAEGTLASRPAANTVEHGRHYRTTDAGAETLSWSDGSLWLPLGLIPQTTSSSASVVSGQALITAGSGALTVTLPSHAAGQMVAVLNRSTGGTTVSGSSIQGLGLSSASTFPLGAVGAGAVLLDDGTSWNLIAGQRDTGWVNATLASGVSAIGGTYAIATRVVGDTVRLRGSAQTTGVSSVWATIAASAVPASAVSFGALVETSSSTVPTSAFVGISGNQIFTGGSNASGDSLGLDGLCYSLS